MKASYRRQQRNESFQEYYLEMEKIFRAMTTPYSPGEKLDILKRNLRAEYKQVLIVKPVNTLSELMSLGKSIDASRTPIYQKVFGNPKEVAIVTEGPFSTGAKHKPLEKGAVTGNINTNTKTKPFWGKNTYNTTQESRKQVLKSNNYSESQQAKSGAAPSCQNSELSRAEKPVISLQYLVDSHRPPDFNICYNCAAKGHDQEACPKPKRVFCVVCGFKGFEASRCPYCLKNGIRTN